MVEKNKTNTRAGYVNVFVEENRSHYNASEIRFDYLNESPSSGSSKKYRGRGVVGVNAAVKLYCSRYSCAKQFKRINDFRMILTFYRGTVLK